MTLHRRGKKEIQKRCSELLRILGIEEVKDKYPYQVSGGQSSGAHVPVHLQIIPHFFWQMSRQGRWIHWQRRHC